jgi:hypothetical protein
VPGVVLQGTVGADRAISLEADEARLAGRAVFVRTGEERTPASADDPEPGVGVLGRGELPLASVLRGDQGLDRVPSWCRLRLTAQDRPADRVHDGDVGREESHVFDFSDEATPP